MSNEEIKELLRIFNESGVGELELQRGRDRLRIRRAGDPLPGASFGPAPVPSVRDAATAPAAAPESAKPAEPDSSHILVKSPIVGTFYDAPSPGAPPFVKVGDKVDVGQVLCIIESMKLMNEIEAEVAGVISAKLVENGRPVEYGEAMFAILPR
jgi:acetyl-CoA carboxylase biotin carboxyl carrier protein